MIGQSMKNSNPKLVSIITPAYKAAGYITETIESVQKQTFTDWEMLIIDDCSPDETASVVRKLAEKDPRIRLLKTPVNSGPAETRNIGLRVAQGRYIAFLDSDDIWFETKLEKHLEFMKSRNCVFSYGPYVTATPEGKRLKEIRVADSVDYTELLRRNIIGTLSVVVDREKTGPFWFIPDPKKELYDDYILWLDILKRGFRAYALQEILAEYRVLPNSVSRNKWKSAQRVWRIYRDIEKLSLPKSIWLFTQYAYLGSKQEYL
jgi:teichuronic acid biosynthesis glycosyltransferase TuaG